MTITFLTHESFQFKDTTSYKHSIQVCHAETSSLICIANQLAGITKHTWDAVI